MCDHNHTKKKKKKPFSQDQTKKERNQFIYRITKSALFSGQRPFFLIIQESKL